MRNHKPKSIANKLLIPFTVSGIFLAITMSNAEDIERAWLGIASSKIDAVLASQLDLPEGVGAAVKLVMPDSPAEKSGIKNHDVIFEIDGEESFRVLEKETLDEIIQKEEKFILATGGGTPSYDDNMEKMNENGIETGIHYRPMNSFKMYKTSKNLPQTKMVSSEIVSLPTHPNLTTNDLDRIVKLTNKYSK